MKSIKIGNQELLIKDYYCSDGTGYYPRDDGKLWLYANLTDVCNGYCPFCINPGKKTGNSPFDLLQFKKMLERVKEHVYGISLTGGEPMLVPGLIDEVAEAVMESLGWDVELDMVTNGFDLERIADLRYLENFCSIHVSKHMLSDEDNDRLFGFHTVSWDGLKRLINSLKDPGAIVLNCVIMKDGIDTLEKAEEYLERASYAGVQNVSFIGMSICNQFCESHYVDPKSLKLGKSKPFYIWSQYNDHDFCSCQSGSYQAEARNIRYYIRSMGKGRASYTRQLVYTADNKLLAGFGGKEILF